MRTVPAAAKLNKRNARKNVGYSVLNVDRSVYAGFTREGVKEERPGFYVAEGGVSAPPAGGYIVWGLKTRVIIEEAIDPAPVDPTPTIAANLVAALTEADRRTSERINRISKLIEAIDISTPVQATQAAITSSVEESQRTVLHGVEQSTLQTNLLTESLTEQINNRFGLESENVQLIETLIARIETNQGEELALGTQIGDILGYIRDIRESVNGGAERIERLEESIRNNADVDATIEEQKVLINEFFELMGAE